MTSAPVGRRLILLRHAKAESSSGSPSDMLRPLALNGRRQAMRVGAALAASGLVPDLVLCSSALRTRQTWELALGQIHGDPPPLDLRDELYSASVDDIVEVVRGLDDAVRTVLVVGHEPTMAAAASRLADASRSDSGALAQVRVGVPTATYSVLESETGWPRWSTGVAVLTYVGRPA